MESKSIEIVPYSEDYKSDVIGLILDIWENEFDYKGLARPDIHNIPDTYQRDEGSNFWVALYRGKLVGTAGLVKVSEDTAHLKRMAVVKDFREHGVGGKLLQTVLEFSQKHRIKIIYAGLVPENTNAIAFYKHHGFTESEFVPEGIVISDNPVCLRLDVSY